VEKEWSEKLDEEKKKSEQNEKWAEEVVKALEKEKKVGLQFLLRVLVFSKRFSSVNR